MIKPSVDEIKELVPKCEGIYGHRDEQFQKDQQFYDLDFKSLLNIPAEYKTSGITLPTARDVVDVFVDHIDIGNARVFANKHGIHDLDKERMEMMRKFYLGIIHRTNVESDISPWRVAAKHYALYGLGVFKTVWDADLWPSKPLKAEGQSEEDYENELDQWRQQTSSVIPIVVQAINPFNILPDPYYGGKLYVIERHRRLLYDVKKMYPHWPNPQGKADSGDYVEFISYWDKIYRCDLIDGVPILRVKGGVVKHNYGFIPYTLIESGLGNLSIDNEPDKRYVGILRYIFDLIISESRNYSISDIVLGKTGFPWGVIKGANAAAVSSIDVKFGQYTVLPEGVELEDKVPQTPPQALNDHLSRTSFYISAHAAPDVLRGMAVQGIRSAADRRLATAEAGAKYTYASDAFRNGSAQVLIKCAYLMKNVVPGNVRVWARTPRDEFDVEIKKDMMKEPFTCYVEFAPVSEEDEYRRHDDLERLVSSGIITRPWARTQMSNLDAEAMNKEEKKELIRSSPAYRKIIDQQVAIALQQALGAAGVPLPMPPQEPPQAPPEAGRRMIPPIPERAAPGSAQEIQTEMERIRSQVPMSPTQGQGGGGFRP